MHNPQQYPIHSPQSISNHRSVSPPLPASPKAYPINYQQARINSINDPRILFSQNFQQLPQGPQQNHFPVQPYNQGNIHFIQNNSVNHMNTPVYPSKPNSPVLDLSNSQNRVYHSQSVHISSPKSINGNINFAQNQQHQYSQQSNVNFNFNGNAPFPNTHIQPLPQPVHQVIPSHPREIQYSNHQNPNQPPVTIQQGYVQQTVVQTEIVWERRFVEIYTKFEIFVQKFEVMIEEVYIIEEQFDSVSDEDGWNELRGRYAQLMNKFNEVRQDIITVLEDNKKAIESLNPQILEQMQGAEENVSNPNEQQEKGQNSSDNVWEHRYYELMQQHDVLSQEYGQIREQFQNLAAKKQGEISLRPTDQRNKVAQLENNLNTLHSEYNQLGENYNKLEEAYSQVVAQLQQQNDQWNQEQAQKMIEALEMETHNSHQKIQYLEQQLRKTSEHKSSPNDQHFSVYQSRIEELLEQKNILIKNMNEMKNELEQYDEELGRRQKIMQNQSNRIYELEQHIENSKKMDAMGEDSLKQQLHNAIQTIRENQRTIDEYRKHLQERERVIEDIARNRDDIARQNEEFFNRIQENQRQMIERQQLVERLERRVKLMSEEHQIQMRDDKVDPGLFSERVKIEVDSAVNDRNRKIRSLTQQLEDANAQIQKINLDKDKSIQKIKEYFSEEEDRKNKLIHEKDNNIRILNDKVRSLEHELSNRNLEISRFRHQSSSTSLGNEESKKLAESMQKKNSEIQKIRRSYEQKCLQIKELEQKLGSTQHQLSTKVFQINTLKRESYEFLGIKSEVESQNSVIKKKNQQINELRLKVIENDQMEHNITSLEREKTRLNELLKQKSRQLETKDNTISNLQKKISNLRMEIGSTVPTSSSKQIDGFSSFDNSLVKQKQTEIRKLKNQLQMKDATISTHQKTIKQKQTKISTQQKTNNLLKAEIENKINRYQNQIKNLQKEIKENRNNKQDNQMAYDSMKAKLISLQNSLQERNVMYDHEIALSKQKIQSVEQTNTSLMIEKEMTKTVVERIEKQNRHLHEKIKNLQQKLESKTKIINDLKATFTKKQKDEAKGYQDKIKQLDGQIKLDSVKMKKMQQLIQQLSNKLKDVETQKRSYRERLLTETSGDRDFEFRFLTEYNETMPNIQIFQMDKFKIKDAESNNVFERKVIYQLKKENDILRKQLSGVGYSSVSLNNRFETQNQLSIYQHEFNTEQNRPEDDHHSEVLLYHKNINKELQQRIDELLKVNRDLKQKIAALSNNSNNQSSIQFYKEQTIQMESENTSLKEKIQTLMKEKKHGRSEIEDFENQLSVMINKNASLEKMIKQLKGTISSLQGQKAKIQNSRAVQAAEIMRLSELLTKQRAQASQDKQKDKTLSDYQQKQKSLEQQIVKLTNRVEIMRSQTERLKEVINQKQEQIERLKQIHQEEVWELRRVISEREAEIQSLRMNQDQLQDPKLEYNVELLRSLFLQFENLVGEICLRSEPEEELVQAIRYNINQGLNVLPTLARG